MPSVLKSGALEGPKLPRKVTFFPVKFFEVLEKDEFKFSQTLKCWLIWSIWLESGKRQFVWSPRVFFLRVGKSCSKCFHQNEMSSMLDQRPWTRNLGASQSVLIKNLMLPKEPWSIGLAGLLLSKKSWVPFQITQSVSSLLRYKMVGKTCQSRIVWCQRSHIEIKN